MELASPDDLAAVHAAYEYGRALQREVGSSVWPDFTDHAILGEIASGNLFRAVDVHDAIAGVFTVACEDPAIWGELERGEHLYLHRIARAPSWTGRGLMDVIL